MAVNMFGVEDPDDIFAGLDAFSSTGSDYDTAYGMDPLSVGYLDDDQLTSAKKRADLLKALYGMMFDSRTGYYGAAEQGRPTFNFPGLTAGSGVEQVGTSEAGSPAEGELIGFDTEGNPIVSSGSSGGGGGGGSSTGGGSRGGMDPATANRFLTGLANSGGEYGPILQSIPGLLETETPASVKFQLKQKIGTDVDPDDLKLINDTIDQAWEASGVVGAAAEGKLPKSSDLGIQVGKWGTVDPTKAYTPDTLPEDILPMLGGEEYIKQLDDTQTEFDAVNEGWNRYLKANKGDSFKTWSPLKAITEDEALTDAGYGADQFAPTRDVVSNVEGPDYAPGGTGKGWGKRYNPETPFKDIMESDFAPPVPEHLRVPETPQPQDQQSGSGVPAILKAILMAANKNRGDQTPFHKNKAGQLLDTPIMVDEDQAKELGVGGWGAMSHVPGGKRQIYTTAEAASLLHGKESAKRVYDQRVLSNQNLRAFIAADLAKKGRTPQRDDMRNRYNMLRNQLGL
jgi:hypothetical protein